MRLRWKYSGEVVSCSTSEFVFGGKNPTKPVWILQYEGEDGWGNKVWIDVPYVREPENVDLANQ